MAKQSWIQQKDIPSPISKQDILKIRKYIKNKNYDVEIDWKDKQIIARKNFARYNISFTPMQNYFKRSVFHKNMKRNHNFILIVPATDKRKAINKMIDKIEKIFGNRYNFFDDGFVYAVVTVDDILNSANFPQQIPRMIW